MLGAPVLGTPMQGTSVLGSLVLGTPILRACMLGMSVLGRCVGPVGTAGTTMLSLFCFPCVTHILPDTGVLGAKLSPWPVVPCQQASGNPRGQPGTPPSHCPSSSWAPPSSCLCFSSGKAGWGGGGSVGSSKLLHSRRCWEHGNVLSVQPFCAQALRGGHCSWACGLSELGGVLPSGQSHMVGVGIPRSLEYWQVSSLWETEGRTLGGGVHVMFPMGGGR